MSITVASWNVNSIRARLPLLCEWLEKVRPDVLLLQEIKCTPEAFPREPLEELGYNSLVCGEKGRNGVAILSRFPIESLALRLPGEEEDAEARFAEAFTGGLRVASLYAPNGNPVDGPRFAYKLRWLARLRRYAEEQLLEDELLVLGGDYNVIPEPQDCYDPAAWEGDALYRPESRRAFRALLNLGLYDAFRALHPDQGGAYTFWDYQGRAFQLDHGIRIDHLLLSPQALDRLEEVWIDREPRGRPKASDHTPILARLAHSAPA